MKIPQELLERLHNIETAESVDKEELKEINEDLYSILVPPSDNADTVAGEMLRAINKIIYRRFNDGDIAGQGYGREVVNPCVRYLNSLCLSIKVTPKYRMIARQLVEYADGEYVSEFVYDKEIYDMLKECFITILKNQLWDVHNSKDMWDFVDKRKDVDNDYEEDDNWDDNWDEE